MTIHTPPSRARRTFEIIRSSTSLIVIALAIGLAIAAVLGGAAYVISTALHHASSA